MARVALTVARHGGSSHYSDVLPLDAPPCELKVLSCAHLAFSLPAIELLHHGRLCLQVQLLQLELVRALYLPFNLLALQLVLGIHGRLALLGHGLQLARRGE